MIIQVVIFEEDFLSYGVTELTMAVSSFFLAVKILDIVGKLLENDSFDLRKTAAAETLFELEPSVKISW